jgi:hypothetical protein
MLLRLWRRVRACRGHMVIRGRSPNVAELLRVTRLDELWPTSSAQVDVPYELLQCPSGSQAENLSSS